MASRSFRPTTTRRGANMRSFDQEEHMEPKFSADGQSVAFDGLDYRLAETIPTGITDGYVPDKTAPWAVKESVQNQLDECFLTHSSAVAEVASWAEIILRDSGRGVDPYTLFLVGESGKRGNQDTVGQHGEGETIATLVALRLGLSKCVASQDWLVVGRFAHMGGDVSKPQVLELVVYRAAVSRRGTVWYYAGPGVAQDAADAYQAFKRHQGLNSTRYPELVKAFAAVDVYLPERPAASASPLIRGERGNLYTRGQLIQEGLWNICCSYNLKTSPGRDRAAFTWEQVKDECARIWRDFATAEDVAAVLDYATRYNVSPDELRFPAGPPAKIVQAGVKLYKEQSGNTKLGWATQSSETAAAVADARALPGVGVLQGYYPPAQWVQDAVPSVTQVVTVQAVKSLMVSLPTAVTQAAKWLLSAMGLDATPVEGRALEHQYLGAGDSYRLILNTNRVAELDWAAFVALVIHEAGHVATSGASDCSRQHTNAVATLGVRLAESAANDPGAWRAAGKGYRTWQEGNQ
jgi:hypothetical protein